MNPLQYIMLINMVFLFVVVVLFFIFKHKEILSFFFPENYNYVYMLESDNNIRHGIVKKNSDLRYEFNKGFYNMYESIDTITSVPDPNNPGKTKEIDSVKNSNTTVYRHGRLGAFLFKEGNEDPLDFRNVRVSGNVQIKKMQTEIDLANLLAGDSSGLMGILKKYGIIFVLVGIVIIIIVLFSMSRGGTPVPA